MMAFTSTPCLIAHCLKCNTTPGVYYPFSTASRTFIIILHASERSDKCFLFVPQLSIWNPLGVLWDHSAVAAMQRQRKLPQHDCLCCGICSASAHWQYILTHEPAGPYKTSRAFWKGPPLTRQLMSACWCEKHGSCWSLEIRWRAIKRGCCWYCRDIAM